MNVLKNKCLSCEYLTVKRIRINSKRVRDYMAAYFVAMHDHTLKESTSKNNTHQLGEFKHVSSLLISLNV